MTRLLASLQEKVMRARQISDRGAIDGISFDVTNLTPAEYTLLKHLVSRAGLEE